MSRMQDFLDQAAVLCLTFLKATGIKAFVGAVGACALFLAFPPKNKDGTFNEKEFFYRLVTAAFFSTMFGDWFADVLHAEFPRLMIADHKAVAYLIIGAPAWWVTRLVAVTLQKREGKDLTELWAEYKKPD